MTRYDLYKTTILLIAIVLAGCDRNRNTRGWDYAPDMYYSEAYDTYDPNPNAKDGKLQQQPVEGTIPRGVNLYPYKKTDEDRLLAGQKLVNPVEVNKESIETGKVKYEIFCMNCHGPLGDGKGNLYTNGKYPYPPASLINVKMTDVPDGDIYHVINVGHGIMAAHGYMMSEEEEWAVVNYIRTELQQVKK
ncbi:cytochrome c [Puteibacter caeruleilacunae]|nr:cytochrome c [Puteibacter caeruleilacunae]